MKPGDYIYYRDKDGATFPGTIIDIKNKVKVKINHYDGNKTLWVKRSNVELQSENP